MGRFHEERLWMSKISIYVILIILLTQLYFTHAEKHKDRLDQHKIHRRRRQAGDIILMGYKAQKALKGTTRPTEFFNRIGKKWNIPPSHGNAEILLKPDDFGGGVYIDDDYVENW